MQLTGNTILITGGGSGIGYGLAKALHERGNTVVISGRTAGRLEEAAAGSENMHARTLDVADATDIARFAASITAEFPALNVLINNAGMMQFESFTEGHADAGDVAERTITTNLLGPIRLTNALLPHLLGRDGAVVAHVTSGLAYVPLSNAATYSATKAALASYGDSMRYQLEGTGVHVVEIAPPYVQTHLTGDDQANDERAMPLDEYIAEVMRLWEADPDRDEIIVERCEPLRFARERGAYAGTFSGLNDAMAGRPQTT
ncbi:MAG: SDR family NAD(P)-dependent oxidoreductase [Planctomycetota bacterium]